MGSIPGTERSERRLEELVAAHAEAFRERFGAGAAPRLFFAPGRVNLMGAHLDYNGGPVLPTAIDRGTFLALRPRADRALRLASTLEGHGELFEGSLDALPEARQGRWWDYPVGVVRDLARRAREHGPPEPLAGLEVLFGGNLPVGAGLSSSASICVGTAFALDRAWGLDLDVMERVRSALRAEREHVGVHCGIMDPYAVGLARPGHLLWLDCKDESWTHVPADFERLSIGVADSGVRRELARGEFNRRVDECRRAFEALRPHAPGAECLRDVPPEVLEHNGGALDPLLRRRAEHVLGEVRRTFEGREALAAGELERFGALMLETHASLRELYEVSCPELDVLVDAARSAEGAFGARLTGAGFGGCVVIVARRGLEAEVEASVAGAFERAFGRRPRIGFYGGDRGPRELG